MAACAFAGELVFELKPAPLSAQELRRTAELIRTQFAHDAWTRYR